MALAAFLSLAVQAEAQSSNNAPTVANEIPDQSATVGFEFSYAFPADTFNDADGDSLTYTATKADDSALPSWLTFDAATRTFSGTPTTAQTVSVKVTASDGNGGTANDTFDIAATGQVLVSNTGQNNPNGSPFSVNRAQSFTTGSNAAGYTLTAVSFPIQGTSAGADLSVSIRQEASNRPGEDLGLLALRESGSTVTGTSPGIDLAANTTYFVVLTGTNVQITNRYLRVRSDDEDPGAAAGWSIGDDSRWSNDDSFGSTSTSSWQLAIGGSAKSANSSPTVANEIPDQTATVGFAFSYAFPANTFADADAGTTLTYTATKADDTALPSWLTFDAATRSFSGTPTTAQTVSVKVTASDGTASVSDTFDITVSGLLLVSNTGQTQEGTSHFSTHRAQSFTTGPSAAGYTLTAVSFPISGIPLDSSLAVRIDTATNDGRLGGSLGSLTLSENGTTVTGTSTGIDLAANTTYFVVLTGVNTYHRTDSDDEDPASQSGWSIGGTSLWGESLNITDSTSWQLAIGGSAKNTNSPNSAPTLANEIPDQTATSGTEFSYALAANTFDDADGDVLVYTATRADGSALPSWLTFTVATRTFAGTPTEVETVSVKVTASDGAASASDTFDITVTGTLVSNTGRSQDFVDRFSSPRAQSFTTGPNVAGYTLTGVSFPVTGNAPSTLSVHIERSAKNLPGGRLGSLTLSQSGSTVTGTTPGIDLKPDTTYFVVLAGTSVNHNHGYHETSSDDEDDGAAAGWSIGNTSWVGNVGFSNSWKIAILGSVKSVGVNAPTVANEIPDQIAPLDAFFYAFPANTFHDADAGTTLTYTATLADDSALPSWLTFDGATRSFSGAPQTSDAGTVSVKVTASDGVYSVSDTFDITVDITAIAPVTETFVSTTGRPTFDRSDLDTHRAQPFTTGPNAAGYTLTGVSFPVRGSIAAGRFLSVRIERSVNNLPGGSLGSLTLSQSGSTVTGTTPGIDLAPETTYFVVLVGSHYPDSNEFLRTNSDDEDPGAAEGWSIGNTSLWDSDFGETSSTSWKIAISGRVKINEGVQSAEAAYANGRTTLTLTFNRALAAVAAPEPWDLRTAFPADGLWGDGKRYVNVLPNRIETSGKVLTLVYNNLEALPDREVEVRYLETYATEYLPSQLLYSADGKKVASFTQTAERPEEEPSAPALIEAQVAGDELTLTFDRVLDAGSAPAGRRFRVEHLALDVGGERSHVRGTGTATVSGSTVTVTLASKVPQGRFARVSYTRGDDANPLRSDSAGPQVADIWWRQAAVLDRDPPLQTGSLLAGTSLVLYYDDTLDTGSTPATNSFTVGTAGNNPQTVTVSGVTVHPNAVELTLGSAPSVDVEVTYTPPGASPVRDAAGNDAASLTSRSVARQASDPGAPAAASASAAATVLTVSFDQSLDPAHLPPLSAFTLPLADTVRADARYRPSTVTGVRVLGSDVELTMNPYWYPCDGSLTVAYAKPSTATSRLQNNWGAEADAFTRTATNTETNRCVFMAIRGSVQPGGQSGHGPQGASGDRGRTTLRVPNAGGDSSQQPPDDASGDATRIALQFDGALNRDSVPDSDVFTVTSHTPGAAPIEVTDVEMPDGADDKLLLSLSRDLAGGEQVTVSYRRPPGESGLWDAQGNQVADFSVDVTAPGGAPVFNGAAQRLDNALPGFLVSLPMRQSDFSDPDGDPLTFTLSASRDDVYEPDGEVPGGFMYNDRLGRVFFLAKTTCALESLDPPTGDAYYTVITMTATDPGGATAHATATFRTDPAAFGCPSLSSATVDGTTVTLTFDADLAPSYTEPTADGFVVKAAGVAVSVAEVRLADADAGSDSGSTISLTLASPVSAGQTVTVSYAPAHSPVAAAFSDRPAANHTPAGADDGYEPDQQIVANVWSYAAETDNGFDHVLRWMRALKTFGVVEDMTAAEAQGYADSGWERWNPVAEELGKLQNAQGEYEPDQQVIADVWRYARETDNGFDHVLRWMRALKTFGVVEDMTAAEAQGYADNGWDRWEPVAEELRKLEASTS